MKPIWLIHTFLAALCATLNAQSHSLPKPVAIVDGIPITAEQVERQAGAALIRLRATEYNLQRRALDEMVSKMLLEKEAALRGIGVAELTALEIDKKALPITPEEERAAIEKNRRRFQGRSDAEVLRAVEPALKSEKVQERRARFLKELRAKGGVRILLDPPRVKVDPGDGPTMGSADAPVTVVEFSEFQCPYCSQAAPLVRRLMAAYPGQIRLVFRDFPLSNIHKDAGLAAEAARCAHDQGKFWQMHDSLFENQRNLGDSDLRKRADAVGLDSQAFNHCMDSRRHFAKWQQDVQDGARYGVNATPTFFVNGRMMAGLQTFEALAQVVEEELASRSSGAQPQAARQP